MDMQEFERNRRKKKENIAVNHINVNTSINKQDFINYNPLENKFKPVYMDSKLEIDKIDETLISKRPNDPSDTIKNEGATNNGGAFENEGTANNEVTFRAEGTTRTEGTFKIESTANREGPFDNEGATKFEGTSKLKAPNKIKINLNSIERVRVSLDSLRIEQIIKQVISESQAEEVVIGRRVFENNGVNTSRFTSAREETRDRGIIAFEKRKDKNGIEHTWYKLK
jgi:hypothetical protein